MSDADGQQPTPGEVIGSHDHRRKGRGRAPVVIALVLVAAFLGWLSHRPAGSSHTAQGTSTPHATPSSIVATMPSTGTAATPGLVVGTRYLRTDGATHLAFLEIALAPTTAQRLQLIRIHITHSPIPMQGRFLTAEAAQAALLAPIPQVFAGISTDSQGTAGVAEPNSPAVLALYLEPDCEKTPYSTYPVVQLEYRIPGRSWPTFYDLPSDMKIETAWFDDAVSEACNGIPHRTRIVQTRTIDGIVMTTTGPSTPNGVQPFAVTVQATNTNKRAFVGQLGVLMFDRNRTGANGNLAGSGGLSVVTVTSQPDLTGWTVFGASSGRVEAVGVGAARTGQRLAPGQSATYTFLFQMENPGSFLGPATGWVPMLEARGSTVPTYPDPSTFPEITRPVLH